MIRVRNGETVTRQRITRDNNGNPVGAPDSVTIDDVVTWVNSATPNFDRRQVSVIDRGFGLPAGADVLVRDQLVRPDGTRWDVTAIESGTVQPISNHDFGYFVVRSQGVV